MAGFFLVRSDENKLNINKALQVFADNGLDNPYQMTLGKYTLYLYSKLTESAPAMVNNENGFCAVIGAYVYQNSNYHESLEKTLADFSQGQLSLSDMRGHYTLIIYYKNTIYMISDAMSAKHFFSDRSFSFFSSSLFAAAAALGQYTINDNAVLEKLLTGIIVSPDTIIKEIIQMNKNEQIQANRAGCGITFVVHPEIEIKPFHHAGTKESEKSQAETILHYFQTIKPAIKESEIDLGLSAGHDSTLLFAALMHDYKDKLHIHTHSTGHVHDREKNAATDMAKSKGMEISVVPTPRLDEENIDLTKLLVENLLFFDGRTSHDIGGFSATYRSQYRLIATAGCRTTFSGVGGECLRNHYSVRGYKINADRFFSDKIFNQSFIDNSPPDVVRKISEYHIEKAEKILHVPLRGKVDRLNLRRYYSEIMMADGQGNVIDAYNCVSRCFAPFLELSNLIEAYRGLPYLGNYGEYESEIINILDPVIGSCKNSNNGYPFNQIPIKVRIKEGIRTRISTRRWVKINNLLKGRKASSGDEYLKRVISQNEMLNNAYMEMKERYSEINLDEVIKGYAMDANIAYIALTMRKLKNEL